MIKVDISKALPATAFNYLAAFIPGLFFEISVLVGNPVLIQTLAGQPHAGYALGYYTSLTIALILAFLLGSGFMLFLGLLQRPLAYAYMLRVLLWKQIIRWVILPGLKHVWEKPQWRRPWLGGLLRYVQMEVLPFSPQLMEVQRCWHLVASNLLQRRYGIKPRETQQIDPGIWYSVLPKLTPQEMRGSIVIIAFHAAGWCGITAIHFAPALKNTYYIGFSLLLIICGIAHDWSLAKWRHNPVMAGLVRVRAALRELREPPTRSSTVTAPTRPDTPDDILSAEADDD